MPSSFLSSFFSSLYVSFYTSLGLIFRYFVLTIGSSIGRGTTSPKKGRYLAFKSRKITATPKLGWKFSHWTLDGKIYTQNPIIVTRDTP